jgi:transcriptional regulator with XRE-family HTH domain
VLDDTTLSPNVTTGADGEPPPSAQLQRTKTIEELARELTEESGYWRNRAAIVTGDAADVHHRSFWVQLDARVASLVKRDPAELLDQLADTGFAWRDIARMIGISVPALRRWRSGERPTGDNRRAIARLLAFAQIVADQVFEPASWMEVPISEDAPTTPVDLYAEGFLDVVFDLATGNLAPEQALDTAEPGWRERYRSDWEVAVADDGQPYIRPKSASA